MTALDKEIAGFTRDPSLASEIADAFGGGGGNAEELIRSWELRGSPELEAANLLPADKEQPEIKDADIAKAAGIDRDHLVPNSATKRGNYVVYAYEIGGRVEKDALLVDEDNKLFLPKGAEDAPHRKAIRAAVEARQEISSAKEKAEDIIRKAKEKAEEILRDAHGDAGEKIEEAAREGSRAGGSPEAEEARRAARARQQSGGTPTSSGSGSRSGAKKSGGRKRSGRKRSSG